MLALWVESLVVADSAYLRVHRRAPWLLESGVVYAEDDDGREEWKDIPETLARGAGDCKDLSAWRIAELRVRVGEWAVPMVSFERRGVRVKAHVVVQRADGRLEDPARALGMR